MKKEKGEKADAYRKRVARARLDALTEFERSGGWLDWLARDLENFSPISHTQRKATAAVIAQNNPDIIALVEVESMEALRKFNSNFLKSKRYPHYMLIDGNDPRGIDVAVLSRFPLTHVRSYVNDTYKTSKGSTVSTFSRDCLVVRADVGTKPLTLFINHFKSQFQDNPERRKKQASRVAEILEDTFGEKIDTELFAVLGDFNQTPNDPSLQPLLNRSWHKEVLSLLPTGDRWTHVFEKGKSVKGVSQLDYILLSKPLAAKIVSGPSIECRGLARYKGLNKYFPDSEKRILKTVDAPGTEASDHCAVFVDVDV